MWCPKCKAEYNPGVTKCADCGVPLVQDLPPKKQLEGDEVDFDCILSTFNPGDIAIIHGILKGSDIDYFIEGEEFHHTLPLGEPARIMVVREQSAAAKELLKDLKIQWSGISLDERGLEETDGCEAQDRSKEAEMLEEPDEPEK